MMPTQITSDTEPSRTAAARLRSQNVLLRRSICWKVQVSTTPVASSDIFSQNTLFSRSRAGLADDEDAPGAQQHHQRRPDPGQEPVRHVGQALPAAGNAHQAQVQHGHGGHDDGDGDDMHGLHRRNHPEGILDVLTQ